MTIPSVAFLGGSIGGWELMVVGIAVLILFGPKRLPEIAKTIGKVTAQLRGAAQDFRDQISKAAEDPAPESPPVQDAPVDKRPEPQAGDGAGLPETPPAVVPGGSQDKGGEEHGRAG